MNEKLSDELLSQKLMKLQRNSRRGLLLFLLGFIGVVCTLVGWLFGQGEENKLPILLFTAVLLAGIATHPALRQKAQCPHPVPAWG